MLDMKQLLYFIAMVEEKNISRAAQRLHMSQPPLSQQLKAMEETLGTLLIDREQKQFNITPAGKTLYEYALKMTNLMEEATFHIQEVDAGLQGSLRIGVNTFSVQGISEQLQRFRQKYPKVTYKLEQNESAVLCEHVRDRTIELAFVRLPLDLEEFSVLPIHTEPYYFITATDMFSKHEIALIDIKDEPILLPSTKGLGVHYSILEAFSHYHVEPNVLGECSDIHLLLDLVANQFACSIVPETVLHQYDLANIHAYPITDPSMVSSVSLIWLKNHRLSRLAQHFIDIQSKS